MPDLSQLSDAELLALHSQATAPKNDLSKLSDDELLSLHAQASAPAKAQTPDMGDAILKGATHGAGFGIKDELSGALEALGSKVGVRGLSGPMNKIHRETPDEAGQGFMDAYRSGRDADRASDDAAHAAHPWVYNGSEFAGSIAGGGAAGNAIKAMRAAPAAGQIATKLSLGQKILRGAGTGAALGAGMGASESRADLTNGKNGGVLKFADDIKHGGEVGGALGGAFPLLGAAVTKGVPWLGKKAARVLTGVDEKNIEAYAQNPERISGAKTTEDLKDAIDRGVESVTGDRDALAKQAAEAEEALNNAYAGKQKELEGAVTPLSRAKDLSASLEGQKATLGSMSQAADQALVDSGATFQKEHLLDAIDKIAAAGGPAIGDAQYSALQKLQATRDRIATQLPNEIRGTQLRDVLKQIRKDTDFDLQSGEFNDALNGMRKELQGQISGALKNASPEYAEHMAKMSELSQSLGNMNRYFGTDAKALGSLESLRKGGSSSQLVDDVLREHSRVNGDQGIAQMLDSMKSNQATLDRMKGGDLRGELFPELSNALSEAKANAQMAADVAAPVERLSQNRSQNIVRNQGFKNASIEDRRALEGLENATGQNYSQDIKDRNVLDAFGKDHTRGSRMTVLGGAAGGAIGAKFGAPGAGAAVGGAVGATVDKYGGQMLKGSIDTVNKIQSMLNNSEGLRRLGPYAKPLMDAAKRGGNQSLAAAHFVLSQSDPKYNSMMNSDASGE